MPEYELTATFAAKSEQHADEMRDKIAELMHTEDIGADVHVSPTLRLTGDEMIADALAQMLSFLRDREEVRKQEAAAGKYDSYEHFSVRELLYTLGFSSDDVDEVIEYCAQNGFGYCIDHNVKIKDHTNENATRMIYPNQDACRWGQDQLLSRLNCVRKL